MSTNNFVNHENGIFVVPETSFEQMKEWMLEDEFFESVGEDGLTDEDVYEQLQFEQEIDAEEFLEYQLGYQLEKKGFNVTYTSNPFKEFMQVYRGEKMLAEIHLQPGYYSGAQVIVETDPETILPFCEDYYLDERGGRIADEPLVSKLRKDYTPNNKRMFKVIRECTTPITKVGQFSNGEAVYELG